MSLRSALLVPVLFSFSVAIHAQQPCKYPVNPVPGNILFSVEQERYLGDIYSKSFTATNRVIEDEQLAAPLQRIGARLMVAVPDAQIHPQFTLVDLPEANAFTLPGGHIYVTKKLVAVARSEDELAGVLAHELGHALTRQIARDYSEMWRVVLNVNAVGDQGDIESKFHRFLETYASNVKSLKAVAKREDKEQSEADAVGIALTIRAGYDPKSYGEFFDRIADTHGRKGNWFSDFFGMTKPDSKRLREILRSTNPPPEDCAAPQPKMTAAEFSDWRRRITSYSAFGKRESLPPTTQKRVMTDPLRNDLRHLQFSPDGKYVLGQDDASIYVMTREPFANLFRIDSESAFNATFTPDSKQIVFRTEDDRVEHWSVADQQLENSYELHIPRSCMQADLSPTGDYFACLQLPEDEHFPMQLAVLDLKSGEPVWVKKNVFNPGFEELLLLASGTNLRIPLEFSPDGRYLVGSGSRGGFGYDFVAKAEVSTGKMKDLLEQDFVFLSGDTVLGIAGEHGEKSQIVKFPSGQVVDTVQTGFGSLFRVAKGDDVIIRPAVHTAATALDLKTKKFFISSKTRALDVYDNVIVSEMVNGKLGLFRSSSEPPIATLDLPKGPIIRFTAVAVSKDLRYVAYSAWMRGAVWELESGNRLSHVRGFRGAFFDADQNMFAEFPAEDSYLTKGAKTKDEYKQARSKQAQKEEREKVGAQAVQWAPNGGKYNTTTSVTKRYDAWQHGPYFIVSERETSDGQPIEKRELEIRDVKTGARLWSRKFPGGLTKWYYNVTGDSFAMVWGLKDDNAKDLIKSDAALRARVDALQKKKGAVLLEVLDHHSGNRRFVLPVDTGEGSFEIRDVDVVGDTVMIADTQDRLVIMDSNGKPHGRLFASAGVLDPTGKVLAAETEPGRITLLSVGDMHPMQTYTFANHIAYMNFSADSKRLIVITADQTFYTFTIP